MLFEVALAACPALSPNMEPALLAAPSSTAALANDATCNTTVAFVFLARESLPLWPVWEQFLSGCARGSFTVHVHSQRPGCCNDVLHAVGGAQLPTNETTQHDLRFRWGFVRAQLALFRHAARKSAPNGCQPQWVHTSSDSCAPVAECSSLARELSMNAGASYVEARAAESSSLRARRLRGEAAAAWATKRRAKAGLALVPTGGVPEDGVTQSGFAMKSAAWTTLWAAHAAALASDEAAIEHRWLDAWSNWPLDEQPSSTADPPAMGVRVADDVFPGGIDEYVWPVELQLHGHARQPHGRALTMVTWVNATHADPSSHPVQFASADAVRAACERAHVRGYLFARKFAASAAVRNALADCLRNTTFAGPRARHRAVRKVRFDAAERCPLLLQSPSACAWTRNWSCPGMPLGMKGEADPQPADAGYYCCCVYAAISTRFGAGAGAGAGPAGEAAALGGVG